MEPWMENKSSKTVLMIKLARIWSQWCLGCWSVIDGMDRGAIRRSMSRKILCIKQWMFIVTTNDEWRLFYWMARMQIWPELIVELTCTFVMGLFIETKMVTWFTFIFFSVTKLTVTIRTDHFCPKSSKMDFQGKKHRWIFKNPLELPLQLNSASFDAVNEGQKSNWQNFMYRKWTGNCF